MCCHSGVVLDAPKQPELFHRCLSFCSPLELCLVAKASHSAHATIDEYITKRWDVTKFLAPFVSKPDVLCDRLDQWGAVIAGSQALQFVTETTYSSSDLDIYVPFQRSDDLFRYFIAEEGYGFVSSQYITVTQATSIRTPSETNGDPAEIRSVCTIAKGSRIIQLVVPRHCVITAVLGSHSTAVVNMITGRRAYCFYPRATLIDRLCLVLRRRTPDEDAAFEKYSSRGFQILDRWEMNMWKDFEEGERWTNDGHSWSFDLRLDAAPAGSTLSHDAFDNGWNMIIQGDGLVRHVYDRIQYCVTVPSVFGSSVLSIRS